MMSTKGIFDAPTYLTFAIQWQKSGQQDWSMSGQVMYGVELTDPNVVDP